MTRRRTPVDFDAIVVTAPNERSARAYAEELQARIPSRYRARDGRTELMVLAAADPAGARVGSGGGTLNALDAVRMAAEAQGRSLRELAVLMVHSGGDSQRSPTNSVCGKAWSALNSVPQLQGDEAADAGDSSSGSSINTPLDLLLEQLLPLFRGVPPGALVVASSDVLLMLDGEEARPQWGSVRCVVGLATRVAAELGPNHGAYVMEPATSTTQPTMATLRPLRRYLQKAGLPELRAEGAVEVAPDGKETVAIDTGVIYFAPEATAALAMLLDEQPFARCTLRGLEAAAESGAAPLRLELYSDMLCALSGGMGKGREEYLRMAGTPAAVLEDLRAARERLWALLNPLPFAALAPAGARFAHLGTTAELMEMMTLKMPAFAAAFRLQRRLAACLPPSSSSAPSSSHHQHEGGEEGAVVLNSLVLGSDTRLSLGEGAVMEHCLLSGGGRVELGTGALVSGLAFAGRTRDLKVRPRMCVQEIRLGGAGGGGGASTSTSHESAGPNPLGVLGDGRHYVVTVLHLHDPIKASSTDPGARVWGQPWPAVLAALGVASSAEAIWPDAAAGGPQTLWTAKLFPVLSSAHSSSPSCEDATWAWAWMQEGAAALSPEAARRWREAERLSLSNILARAEPGVEFKWRRALEAAVCDAVASRRKAALAALAAALREPPRPGCVRTTMDAAWQALPGPDRRWLVGALEEWIERECLAAPDAVDGTGASVLAATLALLARLLVGAAPVPPGAAGGMGGHGVAAADGEMDSYDARWTALVDELLLVRPGPTTTPAAAPASRRAAAFRQLMGLRREWTGGAGGQRCGWLASAAHYEQIAFRLVAQQVAASVAPLGRNSFEPTPLLPPGTSVVATAPARIDLGGGWSDTPPISYEMGGEVTNLAVRLLLSLPQDREDDGKAGGSSTSGSSSSSAAGPDDRPIGCRVTVLPVDRAGPAPSPPLLLLRARQADGSVTEAAVREVAEVLATPPPGCPTAIVKCALRYCGIIHAVEQPGDNATNATNNKAPQRKGLGFQLQAALGSGSGGLCVETWSALPTGSGLGTSSILVGTVLAALGRACGRAYTRAGLVHAVLEVEQMLGVGGGWQDQVGGLLGGLQCARSPQGLPLRVVAPTPSSSSSSPSSSLLPPAARALLESRLVLVYTGRQRLARHMVRSVLRHYYARCPRVLETAAALVQGAKEARRAVLEGDMPALGACLSRYWEMKKTMAGPPPPSPPSSASPSKTAAIQGAAEAAGKQDGGDEMQAAAAAAAASIATTDDDAPQPAFLSCEPAHVRTLMKALQPHCLGMSLAGAGGGGFLVCVLKDPLSLPAVDGEEKERGKQGGGSSSNNTADLAVLQALVEQAVPGAYASRVAVDEEGLRVEVVVA